VPNRCVDPTNCSVLPGFGTEFCGVSLFKEDGADEDDEVDNMLETSGITGSSFTLLLALCIDLVALFGTL
jgi:hypothetical protein